MPKTTFFHGTKVTKEFLNAIQNPIFDGLDLDGHYPQIANTSLDNTTGSLLNDWLAFKNALGVTSVTGLVATYTGGIVTLSDGSIQVVAPGSIALANNATNTLFISRSGVMVASTIYPTIAIPIAQIVTVGGAISGSVIDLRPRFRVSPVPQAIKVFGGLGSEGSLLVTTGNTFFLSGEHYYSDITVQIGATLTINGSASLYCSGNVQIDGTITVVPSVRGGGGYYGALPVQGYPNTVGQGLGGGNSVNQPASPAYDYFTSLVGSGGSGGWVSIITNTGAGLSYITTPRGGNGGGCIIFEAAGTIIITGTININGENGQGDTSVVQSIPNTYTALISGGGGGSGGLGLFKSLRSITVSAAATISVRGGAGGSGYPTPTTMISAGGGGGGYIALYSPNNNTTGATLLLTGGASAIPSGWGSVSGGSFGGVGGSPGQAGSNGILVLRSLIPV